VCDTHIYTPNYLLPNISLLRKRKRERRMLLLPSKLVAASLLAAEAVLAATLTRVDYPNNATSKAPM